MKINFKDTKGLFIGLNSIEKRFAKLGCQLQHVTLIDVRSNITVLGGRNLKPKTRHKNVKT